jgi:hypothetical protein
VGLLWVFDAAREGLSVRPRRGRGSQGDDRDAECVSEQHDAGLAGGAAGYVAARFELTLDEL